MPACARRPLSRLWFILAALCIAALACSRSAEPEDEPAWRVPGQAVATQAAVGTATRTPFLPPTRIPGSPILTPHPR